MEHFKESLGEGWETNLDKIEIYQKKKKINENLQWCIIGREFRSFKMISLINQI